MHPIKNFWQRWLIWYQSVKKIRIVISYEIYVMVWNWSFAISALFLPAITVGGSALILYWDHKKSEGELPIAGQRMPGDDILAAPDHSKGLDSQAILEKELPLGYVDLEQLIRIFPKTVEPGTLLGFDQETDAIQALAEGQIRGFYVIDQRYTDTGILRYSTDKLSLSRFFLVDPLFKAVLHYNLANGDQKLLEIIDQPVLKVQEEVLDLSRSPAQEAEDPNKFLLPFMIGIFSFSAIFGTSTLLINSFSRETENRVMEVLLTSISAQSILWGKLFATWLVGLFIIVFSMTNIGVLVYAMASTSSMGYSILLTPDLFWWSLVLCILGYLLYGVLMMSIAMLFPHLRESSQLMQFFSTPVFLCMLLIFFFGNDPNNLILVSLSIFPLTAPIIMVARMSYSQVPTWQPLLACTLMFASTASLVWLLAHLFTPPHLLSGSNHPLVKKMQKWVEHFGPRKTVYSASSALD